jgi:hypothetical protein
MTVIDKSEAVAALDELILTVSNVVRKSVYGSMVFSGSIENEKAFDQWQDDLLTTSNIVLNYWKDTGHLCEDALDLFEKLLTFGIFTNNKE